MLHSGDMDRGVLLALQGMEDAVNKGPPSAWEQYKRT